MDGINDSLPPISDDLLVVIVIYNKNVKEVLERVLKFPYQASQVYIYDNSPKKQKVDSGFIYIHDPGNSGVSKAYNEAFKVAKNHSIGWMLFLDQDTVCTTSYLRKFRAASAMHKNISVFMPALRDRIGIVSPFRWMLNRGWRIGPKHGRLDLKKYRFANSGVIISTACFEKSNGYSESFPLDFSDIAFCQRLRNAGAEVELLDETLHHHFSGGSSDEVGHAINRFNYFLKGSIEMRKVSSQGWLFSVWAFVNAAKLSLRYRNLRFVKHYMKTTEL